VLTMRLPDPGRMLGLPGALARPLGRRIRAVNRLADDVAVRFGTLHFDAAEHPEAYQRRMWSVDRLHPSERGHRLVARGYADLLGLPESHWPAGEPGNPVPTRRDQFGWMATKGTRWVLDRSTDLVPYLLGMAVAEWWYGLRGLADRLDRAMECSAVRALEAVRAFEPAGSPLGWQAWPDLMDAQRGSCAR
jgi:hypothetical protein